MGLCKVQAAQRQDLNDTSMKMGMLKKSAAPAAPDTMTDLAPQLIRGPAFDGGERTTRD